MCLNFFETNNSFCTDSIFEYSFLTRLFFLFVIITILLLIYARYDFVSNGGHRKLKSLFFLEICTGFLFYVHSDLL